MEYHNGDVYQGNWVGGERNGEGNYVWKSGETYFGNWVGDKMHGSGRLSKKGKLYQVQFNNGALVDKVPLNN